jgi:RNA polymerase sigma factor for flagellar operon FliA
MIDELRKLDFVPRSERTHAELVADAAGQLWAESGRAPDDDAVRERLGVTPEQYQRMAACRAARTDSLSAPCGDQTGADGERVELLADGHASDPAADPGHTTLRDVMLANFSLSDALLVRMRYVDDLTFKAIAESFRVTESCVSIRHAAIVKRLKSAFTRDKLLDLFGRAA